MKRNRKVAGRFATITSCISTTLVLLLLGAVVFFVLMANNFGKTVRENFSIEVLVADSVSQQSLHNLQKTLREMPYTYNTNYVSKQQTTREMAEALDLNADEGFLDYNPLPQEFELYLKAPYVNADSLSFIIPMLKEQKGVLDVIYPGEELQGLDKVIPILSITLLFIALLLGFVSIALINNTIRLNVYSRRFSIHTMKLVGAKWSFIRKPFLWKAFKLGFISASLASALIGFCVYYIYVQQNFLSSLITPKINLITLGCIFLFGVSLTLICAYISVNRFLRMNENDIYFD